MFKKYKPKFKTCYSSLLEISAEYPCIFNSIYSSPMAHKTVFRLKWPSDIVAGGKYGTVIERNTLTKLSILDISDFLFISWPALPNLDIFFWELRHKTKSYKLGGNTTKNVFPEYKITSVNNEIKFHFKEKKESRTVLHYPIYYILVRNHVIIRYDYINNLKQYHVKFKKCLKN